MVEELLDLSVVPVRLLEPLDVVAREELVFVADAVEEIVELLIRGRLDEELVERLDVELGAVLIVDPVVDDEVATVVAVVGIAEEPVELLELAGCSIESGRCRASIAQACGSLGTGRACRTSRA